MLKRFLRNSSGATALIAAIAAVPLFLAAGMAVDTARVSQATSKLQAALDAGALAAASTKADDQTRIIVANDTFAANIDGLAGQPNVTFYISGDKVVASVSLQHATTFAKVAGFNFTDIHVESEVKIPTWRPAEIAMVLDYSSSMNSNNKWRAMRDAALDLVDIVTESNTRNDIKIGLVPFAKMVAADLPSQYVIEEAPTSPWTGTGCTQDRKWPFNTQDTTPTSDNPTKWGAVGQAAGTCAQLQSRSLKIMPLTNNIDGVISKLNSMTPHVGTHISLGLEFGWHLISPNPPFTEGVIYGDAETLKTIVLLTDGEQTTKAWGPSDSYEAANGEANLETLCDGIKSQDVLLITIAFDLESGSTRNRLRNCATSQAYFFEADSNTQLASAFTEIAALIKGKTYVSR